MEDEKVIVPIIVVFVPSNNIVAHEIGGVNYAIRNANDHYIWINIYDKKP